MAVVCPECDNPIVVDVDEVEEGETVQCEECGMDLEMSRWIRWSWRRLTMLVMTMKIRRMLATKKRSKRRLWMEIAVY